MLKSHGEAPIPDTRLTLVSAKRHTPYSGMLPGLIAGHYDFHQCHIDLECVAGYRAGRPCGRDKRNGRRDRRLPAPPPTRGEEEEPRETCSAVPSGRNFR